MFGWTGNILKIDLTQSKAEKIKLDESLYHSFLGGRGINSKLLYDSVTHETDPLGS